MLDLVLPMVVVPEDAVALVDAATGEVWTHGRLGGAVAQVARALACDEKRLVFCACANDPVTVISYLGASRAGHAVAMVDATLPEDRWRALLDAYRPDFVVGGPRGTPPVGTTARDAGIAGLCIERLEAELPGPVHPALGLLLSTSGSTGSPKFVRLSQRAVAANASSIALSLGLDAGERALASLPLHYSYGLSVINSHLASGAALVLTGASVMEPAYWAAAEAHQATSMAGVPYTYEMLARLGVERRLPRTVRTMTQAGGRLSPALVQRFHEFMEARGGRFFVMYGQTEATARMAYLPPNRLPAKLGTVGLAIPGGRFSIEHGGTALPPGSEGEIVYRGPNVMMGYATRRRDLALGDELGGVLPTGDLGRLDADGFLTVTGRTKRIAKVFGVRLNLDEVEALARRHGPAAVVSRGDRLRVVGEFGAGVELAALGRELAAALRIHHAGVEVVRTEQLPLTPNGKTDYARLEADG